MSGRRLLTCAGEKGEGVAELEGHTKFVADR